MARIVFFGTPTFAVPALHALAGAGADVVAVVTQPDRPQGRGRMPSPSPVKAAASALALPVLQPESCRDPAFLEAIGGYGADYFVVVAYGQIFPRQLLSLPRKYPVNLHASLLPRWRGGSPVAWAILSGDTVTGVSTMVVRPALDTGELLLKATEPIRDDDTAATLGARLSFKGAGLLAETIEALEAGRIVPVPQDEGAATYGPLLKKEDGRIDWGEAGESIDRKVRALYPWPKAFTTRGGTRLILLGGRPTAVSGGMPGEVACATDRDGLVIATGRGGYSVTLLQPENHAPIAAGDFIRGYRVVSGERWGDER